MEHHRAVASKSAILAIALSTAALLPVFGTGGDSFDEPAPPLGDTLDFLPGKSLGEIFLETSEDARTETAAPDFEHDVNALAERLRTESPAALVPAADDLLVQARRHYENASWCNLLHDVRDVLLGSAADQGAAADYIKWRVAHRSNFSRTKSDKSGEPADDDAGNDESSTAAETELDQRLKTVTGPLRAHWYFLRGALTYNQGDRDECRRSFERVIKEFPKHPRAEIALFMLARCAFSDSRKGIEEDEPEQAQADPTRVAARKKAEEWFERYRKQYPQGRFGADAFGWLGALAYDGGNYLKALDFYIAQAESRGHPEMLKSAAFMCEKCLARIAAKPNAAAAYALVARHPRIAMGFTYLVLSAAEADNYDGKFDAPADVKKWRRVILPQIAAAVAKQKDSYKSGDWQPRYLALLAQAASAAGKQDEALQLTNLTPDQLERSDDLLLVRALAFSRSGKVQDAIAAYRTLLEKFPKTPIAPGARLRLALALQDNHQAGDALVELRRLLANHRDDAADEAPKSEADSEDAEADDAEPAKAATAGVLIAERYTTAEGYPQSLDDWSIQESAVYPNISGAEANQVARAVDTLLNFAPLPELASALENPSFDDDAKAELRKVIAERYLAAENFSEAQKFAPADAKGAAANLQTLTSAAQNASGDKADQMLRVADAWADARGRLLNAPLDTKLHLVQFTYTETGLDLLRRREDGRSVGLKNIDAELSERDELRHASRWWMNAARARPGSPLAAQARWKALEAMPKIARESPYAEQVAREINSEAVSRELYQRLRTECPDSNEAKQLAAYWSFPPADPNDFSGEVDSSADRDANMLGYAVADYGAFELKEFDSYAPWNEIMKRTEALREHAAQWTAPQMAAEVGALDALARKNISQNAQSTWVNFFDDLVQFFAEPNITPEMQKTYVNVRMDVLHRTSWLGEGPTISTADDDESVAAEIDAALTSPSMKPVSDYLAMCKIGLVAGARKEIASEFIDPKEDQERGTYISRDYVQMEKMARDFLQKYPRSKKREAAVFVLARAVQGLSRPYVCSGRVLRPGADPKSEDAYDFVQKELTQEPFDPKRVLAAFDDYDREFPQGRYAADIRNYRAMALWRTHRWPEALDLTNAQLDDAAHPELQAEAGVRLANIFAAIEQAESRADVLDVIRARPAVVRRLKQYLAIAPKMRTHPLRYLTSYVTEQLNLSAVASN